VFVRYDKEMLVYFAEDLFYNKNSNLALNIVKRHGISELI